jgi:hypothetical protein
MYHLAPQRWAEARAEARREYKALGLVIPYEYLGSMTKRYTLSASALFKQTGQHLCRRNCGGFCKVWSCAAGQDGCLATAQQGCIR